MSKSSKHVFFSYYWFLDEKEEDVTSIRIYGINDKEENICVRVDDFQPYVYIELPSDITWTGPRAQILGNKLDQLIPKNKAISKSFEMKYKLYGVQLDEKGNRKKFPYLKCTFSHKDDIKKLGYALKKSINVLGIGFITLKMHEQDADPILQFVSNLDIPTAGWICFKGQEVEDSEKITLCHKEYIVKSRNICKYTKNTVGNIKIMGFDIEVNSTNPFAMPSPLKPGDKVFQISCVFTQNDSGIYDNYLLTLGEPDQNILGDDINIKMFDTEYELLEGFTELIREKNPNIIVGYNILQFDIHYMIERAKREFCGIFYKMGFHKYNNSKEKTIKWSSSAYKNQEFQFLDAEGRIFVDLLPLIQRDYKFNNYQLKTVSINLLGDTKDDLSVKNIFKCYRIGTKKELGGTYSPKAKKAMGIVGRYCVKDSILVVKLMEKMQTWVGLCEQAKTYNTSIFSIYTQGQQIKVFSQVYKYCLYNDIVVEKDGYIAKEDERYVGAHVFPPVPGLYNRVLPFDFSSLYPTTIIAYNIDYSTIIFDDSIPDRLCHVMSWSDHVNCSHDPKVIRKNQLTEYIDKQQLKLKELREKRDKKINKICKDEIVKEIDQIIEEVKPYREERAQLSKTISKNVMCAERYYRFLKEPKGVIPTILQNLLDARSNTRSEIKLHKKEMLEIKDKDRLNDLKLLNVVLDKRQLAYKISANSMYGAMGVKKGYLPFMPGAMCLYGDSLISYSYGFTRKIKDLTHTNSLWSYNEKQIVSNGNGLIYNGKREIVKITLIDGRTLKCTSDHKIMTTNGWIEAGKLLPKHNWDGNTFSTKSEYSKVVVGLELPEDIVGDDEKNWKILDYTMDSPENREKTLAFCRILGFILSDGSISSYLGPDDNKLLSCIVSIGTLLDSNIFVNDIKLLCGKEPKIINCERNEIKGNIFVIHIPKILIDKIVSIDGVLIGKRICQPYTLPSFLFEADCPLSVIREFLGGLFGGDGTSPSLSVAHPSFSPIQLGWSTIEKYKDDMNNIMNKICNLLSKFGLTFWLNTPRLARVREYLLPKDIEENPRWEYIITTNSCFSLLFAEKIGFRYCSDKNNKLTVAASYQRYSDNVRKQHINLILKTSEMYVLNNKKVGIKEMLIEARKEVYENEIPLHEYSSLSKSADVNNHRSRPGSLKDYKLLQKYFPIAREYTKMVGCEHWFSEKKGTKKVYSLDRNDTSCPCINLDVLDVRYDGLDDVYDIIDMPDESFVANGIIVHNCTTYMGRTNIEIVAKVIPEKYGGELVYGDTDSNYIHFPDLKTAHESWEHAEMVAEEVSKLFPKPISLAFEEAIYWQFFILTKKRYMYKSCGKNGVIEDKIGKKGVILARRDSAVLVRTLYEKIIEMIFKNISHEDILYFIIEELNKICSNSFPHKDYVITKAVGDVNEMTVEPFIDEKGIKKARIGNYTVPILPTTKSERDKQLLLKDADDEDEYYKKCLPAVVQLAEKMRSRGQRVDAGTRLEYVIIDNGVKNDKQYNKLENLDYFESHSDILKIDFMYYVKLLINPIDQLLNVAFDNEKNNKKYKYRYKKDFLLHQYDFRSIIRAKVIEQIKNLFKPKIEFEKK